MLSLSLTNALFFSFLCKLELWQVSSGSSDGSEGDEDSAEPTLSTTSATPTTSDEPDNGAWKTNMSFVLRLGCLTSSRVKIPSHNMTAVSLRLSEDYRITGYQDSNDDTLGGIPAFVEINSTIFVLLEARALGVVLGMEHVGLPVITSGKLAHEQRVELMRHVASKPRNRNACPDRIDIKSLEPLELRAYVLARKKQLLVTENDKFGVFVGHAYCLKEEYYHRTRYNWAAYKVNHLKKSLRCKRSKLSCPDTKILARYIAAAAPTVYQLYEGLEQQPSTVRMRRQVHTHAARTRGPETAFIKPKQESVIPKQSPRGGGAASGRRQAPALDSFSGSDQAFELGDQVAPPGFGTKKRRRRNSDLTPTHIEDIGMDGDKLIKAINETKNTAVELVKHLADSNYARKRDKLVLNKARLKQAKRDLAKDRENLRLEKFAWLAKNAGLETAPDLRSAH